MNTLERFQTIEKLFTILYNTYEGQSIKNQEEKIRCLEYLQDLRSMIEDIPVMTKYYGDEFIIEKLRGFIQAISSIYFVRLMTNEQSTEILYVELFHTFLELGIKEYFVLVEVKEPETSYFRIVGTHITQDTNIQDFLNVENMRGKHVAAIVLDDEISKDFAKTYDVYIDIVSNYLVLENYEVSISD